MRFVAYFATGVALPQLFVGKNWGVRLCCICTIVVAGLVLYLSWCDRRGRG